MNGREIFNLQRFLILQTKLNPQTSHLIDDDYAYAWYAGVYPFFSERDLHEDLAGFFRITKEQMNTITKYLDDEWLNGNRYNFYELEDHFGCRSPYPVENIDRLVLLEATRYMYLRGGFDNEFWEKLVEPMKHPAEASRIVRDFDINDIYLI